MWSQAQCCKSLHPAHLHFNFEEFPSLSWRGRRGGGLVTCQAECGWHGSRRSLERKHGTWMEQLSGRGQQQREHGSLETN